MALDYHQIMQLKAKYQDAIMFVRIGDFYEAFADDAVAASKALDLTLTSRQIQGAAERIPMAGVPYHAVDVYIAKLIEKGFKVAIAESAETTPKENKERGEIDYETVERYELRNPRFDFYTGTLHTGAIWDRELEREVNDGEYDARPEYFGKIRDRITYLHENSLAKIALDKALSSGSLSTAAKETYQKHYDIFMQKLYIQKHKEWGDGFDVNIRPNISDLAYYDDVIATGKYKLPEHLINAEFSDKFAWYKDCLRNEFIESQLPEALLKIHKQQKVNEVNKKWQNVSVPQNCLLNKYEKSSLFRMPEGSQYAGYVFYIPNSLYKDGTEIVDLQSDTRERCYRIKYKNDSVFNLKNKTGNEQKITAAQFTAALSDSVLKAYQARENAPRDILYNNTREYEKNIPVALRQKRQFVCMELIWNTEKSKFDKMIVNPITGGNAQVDNPATWCDFKTACEAARKGNVKGRRVDGIGYIISNSENIIGIDLDLDKHTKQLTEYGNSILANLEGKTYIEYSASGAIHAFGYGEKPGDRSKGREDNSLEIYGSKGGNRCLMFTGKLYQGKMIELNDIQSEVNEIYQKYFYVEPVQRAALACSPTLSEREVIDKIQKSKSADKFNSLMSGDISGHSNDYNRADLALCSIVAFFTQDKAIIDGIYRQSNLYSATKMNGQTGRLEGRAEKWDKHRSGGTYGEKTIEMAVANVLKTYTRKEAEFIEVEPLRIFKSTEKAVMVKIEDASAHSGKRYEWLPNYQIQTDKEKKNVLAAEKSIVTFKILPLKKNTIAATARK